MRTHAHPKLPSQGRRRHADCRGLTVVELMVGTAMAATLMAVAVPSYNVLVREMQLASQGTELAAALVFAASEAARRGVRVTVCPASDVTAPSPACSTAAGWNEGWLVFVDNVQVAGNEPGAVDGADSVLRVAPAAKGAQVYASSQFSRWIAYRPDLSIVGSGGGGIGSLKLCQGKSGLLLTLNMIGLPQSTKADC